MSGESSKARIAILISGRGSNMIALVDAVRDGTIPNAEISVVISDQPNAAGLAKAAERGIETLVIKRGGRTREEHDREKCGRASDFAPPFPGTVEAFMRLVEAGWDAEAARRPHGHHTTVVAHVDV